MALSGPLVPQRRRSRVAGAVLDGVNVASLALMAAVTLHLARATFTDGLAVVLAAASLWLLVHRRVGTAWLVAGGAAIGVLTKVVG